jgi:threonine aldolase
MRFASDNRAGVCPEVLDALVDEAGRYGAAYGEDDTTARLGDLLAEVFDHEVWAYPVLTGTAANSLALASLCDPWGGVLCSDVAHVLVDECGAPEFYGGGLRLVPLVSPDGRIDPLAAAEAIDRSGEHDVHNTPLQALSLTNLSEMGSAYRATETAALCHLAHDRGLSVHLDGARLANAVVGTGEPLAELTWRAGVDVVSFGGTKNGAASAEAVVLFDDRLAEQLERRRKRAGQLLSKMRLVSVQLVAQLSNGVWLRHAAHANEMAARLANALAAVEGIDVVGHPDGNELFVSVAPERAAAWRDAGAEFYDSPSGGRRQIRLVTSWSTSPEEVDRFTELANDAQLGAIS